MATTNSRATSTSSVGKDGKKRRIATVYDAVAGRVTARGFVPAQPIIASTRDTQGGFNVAVPPEEVLFRRKGAPTRYEEEDVYFANERLDIDQELPDSDLLKAIHTYVTDFYARTATSEHEGLIDWRSMDETALLALGILLEESVDEELGETGDLVFVEEEDQQDVEGLEGEKVSSRYDTDREEIRIEDDRDRKDTRRKSKRRKIDRGEE
ncbi:MAG: autophagy protein 5 [Chaenotheca gracillima]|nr:MAG: autophagy protein 5 [Chaenotheca gracillima]